MTAGRDDDALTWDGDDDPTLDLGASAGADARADADAPDAPSGADAVDEPRSPGQASAVANPGATLPEGYTAVGKGSEAVASAGAGGAASVDADVTPDDDGDASDERPHLGNGALVGLGVLGGVYLLFTVGWIIGGLRLNDLSVFLVSPAASVPALWLAVLAPALWFGTVLLLTRRSALWLRFILLVAGAVLMVPWPFIMLGAVGS
ncbi:MULTISPECIES: DNA polymerase III subunit gamma/tau [Microbacterium]|uniref:DNA polymerase III subunit gamma/tau n=1 Tax=Microbacterium TaxID=33882 RepID=UPI000D65BCFA|nr:DNA polymerase III subunit gamma/tau [Microbacterium sp. KCTC 39802]